MRALPIKLVAGLCIALGVAFLGSCRHERVITLEFPVDADLGELWAVEDVNCFTCGNGREAFGRATGTKHVRLPAGHWYASLKMPPNAHELMPRLREKSLQQIGEIDLEETDVTDEDLAALEDMQLAYIVLSGTKITGTGLKHLKPRGHWLSITLSDCTRLELSSLRHFQGWRRLLLQVSSRGRRDRALDERLVREVRELVCGGAAEDVCGIQVR